MKSQITVFLIIAFVFIFSITACHKNDTIKDIDGNVYKTVIIGKQIRLAENLNTSHFLTGDTIPEAKTVNEWLKALENHNAAWCYYDYNLINGKKYGKLYNFFAINSNLKFALVGWHISKDEEWTQLTNFLGKEDIAGKEMKSTFGWKENKKNSNSSGFTGLPGGYILNGIFEGIDSSGIWWSSPQYNSYITSFLYLNYKYNFVMRDLPDPMMYGLSVRCVKD